MIADEFTCVHCGSDLAARAGEGLREAAERDAAFIHAATKTHPYSEDCRFCVDAKERAERLVDIASENILAALGAPDHE